MMTSRFCPICGSRLRENRPEDSHADGSEVSCENGHTWMWEVDDVSERLTNCSPMHQ